MFVRDPEIIDIVQQRGIELGLRAQGPRIIKYLPRQPGIHQDRSAESFNYDAGVPNEMDVHGWFPANRGGRHALEHLNEKLRAGAGLASRRGGSIRSAAPAGAEDFIEELSDRGCLIVP